MKELLSGILILGLCFIHVFFPYIEQTLYKYKKIWVSVADGIAVGYVFMYLLPKLTDYTIYLANIKPIGWEFFEYRTYLFALIGFLAYFAADIWSGSENPRTIHWKLVQGLFFCGYNFFMGYILPELPRTGLLPIFLVALALGAHFMGINHLLFEWHSIYFKKVLRWLMAASLTIGWLIGLIIILPKIFKISAMAFIAGAILINVMTEELPYKNKKRYLEFLAGVAFFVIIALIIRSIPRI